MSATQAPICLPGGQAGRHPQRGPTWEPEAGRAMLALLPRAGGQGCPVNPRGTLVHRMGQGGLMVCIYSSTDVAPHDSLTSHHSF
ncbi:galactose-1-epimerase, partial [Aeromonas veronii]